MKPDPGDLTQHLTSTAVMISHTARRHVVSTEQLVSARAFFGGCPLVRPVRCDGLNCWDHLKGANKIKAREITRTIRDTQRQVAKLISNQKTPNLCPSASHPLPGSMTFHPRPRPTWQLEFEKSSHAGKEQNRIFFSSYHEKRHVRR